ncbi:glycoside hydrolase [Pedobacter sp. BS3]|nr:glycoside hydrolase [Pedobacter sp. BS3]
MRIRTALLRGAGLCLAASILFTSCKSKKVLSDASSLRGQKKVSGNVRERYAELLNVPERQIRNERLYRFVDDWMGVPYRDNGMDKRGVDCSGFTSILEKEVFNTDVPRIARVMADNVKRKYEDQLEEGDLVFFDFNGKKFSHVGVYLQNNKFVHASSSKGVIISDLKDPWYYKYFSRGGTLRN